MYIHLHRRLLERSEFRAVWNQDADSIPTSVEIYAHAVEIKPLVVRFTNNVTVTADFL